MQEYVGMVVLLTVVQLLSLDWGGLGLGSSFPQELTKTDSLPAPWRVCLVFLCYCCGFSWFWFLFLVSSVRLHENKAPCSLAGTLGKRLPHEGGRLSFSLVVEVCLNRLTAVSIW